MLKFILSAFIVSLGSVSMVFAVDVNPELKLLQGNWQVTELVEDGKVIPQEALRTWLPSGGHVEIVDNAIIFTSPADTKKYVKIFSISPTQYPKTIDISTKDGTDGLGVYRFDEGRLVICLTHPTDGIRPTEFSAKEGSKRMLMVLKKTTASIKSKVAGGTSPEKLQSTITGAAGKIISDAQVAELLKGTWRYQDNIGSLFATFSPDGSFSTVREVQELRLFQKVFVQTPVSTGKWSMQNGKLRFLVLTSTDWTRVNKAVDFTIRSISTADFIFVDHIGRVGRATKVR